MPDDTNQSPEAEGISIDSAAQQISGLLDDDGHFNPNPDQLSRAHPDYDEAADERAAEGQARDERGRFAKQQAEEEEIDDSDQFAADQMTGDEEDEDTEVTAEGDTDETQDQSATEDTEADQEETGEAVQTLSEMAEALEMTVDELKESLTHSFRAADEDVTVTLAELEKGYQKDADYRRQTGKLAEDRRSLELATTTSMQQYEMANADLASGLNAIQAIFENSLNNPEMEQLRSTNPAEWNARRTEIGEKLQMIQNVRQQAAQRFQTFMTEQQTQLRAREQGYLKEKKPDFSEIDMNNARETMASIGYVPQEIDQIFDHRLVMAALEMHDLRKEVAELRAEKSKAKDTAKRVKKNIPQMQRPGKKKTASGTGIKRDNLNRLQGRLKKSGKVEDAAKVIEQFI